MCRLTALIATALLGLSQFAFPQPRHQVVHQSADLGLAKTVIEGIEYDKVSLPRLITTLNPGEPELPVQMIYLVLPNNMKIDSLHIVYAVAETLQGSFYVYPHQPAIPVGSEPPPFTAPMPEAYESELLYPGVLAEVASNGYLGGYHIASILVYPIQYIPSEKKLVFYRDIDFVLSVSPGVDGSVPRNRITERCAKLYRDMVKRLVANPEDVSLEKSTIQIQKAKTSDKGVITEPVKISTLPSEQGNPVEYVIITTESFKSKFDSLAAWKTKKGVTSSVITIEHIDQYYHGCDQAEKIRDFIKDAYTKWGTAWVLLAGDVDKIAYRNLVGAVEDFPCDQYYYCLEGNWNRNGNDLFAEDDIIPTFKSLSYYDDNFGLMISGNYVFKTLDGGLNWSITTKLSTTTLNSIFLSSQNRGFIAGTAGSVYRSDNGGYTWEAQETEVTNNLRSIYFYDDNNGFSVGEGGTVITTNDGGANWDIVETGVNVNFYGVFFIDGFRGWIVGGNGTILHTADGGVNWSIQPSGTTRHLMSVYFISPDTGWASGLNGTILRTTDGGSTWSVSACPVSLVLTKIYFTDYEYGWACGGNGVILNSTDGGVNWFIQRTPTSSSLLYDMRMFDRNNGIAVGNVSSKGTILATANGGDVWSPRAYSFGDSVDHYPDVFVARAPLKNESEASIFINKLKFYESEPTNDYLNKMLFIGADWSVFNHSGQSKDSIDLWYVQQLPQFYGNVTKLYPYPPYSNLNRTEVITALNQGYGIVNHSDHAEPYRLGAGILTGGGWINRVDVAELTNISRPCVIFSVGCRSGAFHKDCIAKHFISRQAGAIAFIGHSSVSYYDPWNPSQGPSEYYDQMFFKTLLIDSVSCFGMTHAMAKASLIGTNKYFSCVEYVLNAFGDPEMPIWTDNPRQFTVIHPASIPIGQNTVLITVADNLTSAPIKNAYVCLQKGSEAYATGFTDNNGQITFDYTPESTGEANVTVTTQNYIPYQGGITVEPAAMYLCYDSSPLDDDDLDGTQGNDDGIANPGETVDMLLGLKNNGTSPVSKLNTSLITNSEYITPNSLTASRHESIMPGETGFCDQPCRFTVASDCPEYHRAVFLINITSGAYASADSFVVTINADSLANTGHRLLEITGNGNGIIDPGETIQVADFEVTNFGSGGADGAIAELTSADPYITFETGQIAIGAIPPDGKANNPSGFVFYVSELAPVGRTYIFSLTLKDSFNRQWINNNFKILPIASPTGLTASSTVNGVELKWNIIVNAIGYHIYRSLISGGPYERINKHAVMHTSMYLDCDALPNEQYYYVVTALDDSYNESGFSNQAQVLCPLAYKPGWPQNAGTRGDLNFNSALPGDIDGDGDKEIVLGTNDGHIFAWHHDGTAVAGWPKYFPAALVSVALADIDKDGITDIIAGVGDVNNFIIYAWDVSGNEIFANTIYSGAGSKTESVLSISDLDLNGRLDIIIGCKSLKRIYAFEWSGTALIYKWDKVTDAGLPSGIAIGAFNGSDRPLIIVGTRAASGTVYAFDQQGTLLWQSALGSSGDGPNSYPVIGDVNNDQVNEIVVTSGSYYAPKKCFILNAQGNTISTWDTEGEVVGSPTLADIDVDGDLEIITGRIYNINGLMAWHHNGDPVVGWPKSMGDLYSSPSVTDINDDGLSDIFTGGLTSKVWGYSGDLSVLPGFPIPTLEKTYSSPFICDLDINGRAEVGIDMFDGKMHLWEMSEITTTAPEWPMFHHDAMSSGRYGWLNEFSGPITRNLTLSGDNFFNGDVVIEPGATVTLRPGARLYFTANRDVKNLGADPNLCELIVRGSLIAQGTDDGRIHLLAWAAENTPGGWHGIRIEPGGTAQLKHCVIENAVTAVNCDGSSPSIEQSSIRYCSEGISVVGGNPLIKGNSITNNLGAGIYCRQSSAQISDNLIANNGYESKNMMALLKALGDSSSQKGRDSTGTIGTGIVAYESNLTVTGNTIRENYTGFYSNGSIRGTITGNTFENNVFQGMDLMATSLNIAIAGNTFINNGGVYNWPWELAGISIGYRNLTEPSFVQIENNTFLGNFAGARCTRYGRNATNKLMFWLRGNSFVDGNQVGFSVSADMDPNLEVIGVNNRFDKNARYGIIVHSLNSGLVNLGNLGNEFKGDDGGNRLYGNLEYELYHNAPGTMMAEGNYWNSKVPKEIDARIYDDDENPSCGPVDFEPFYFWGELEADAVWSGTVSLAGDVVVPSDGTLQIEAGTTIRFAANMDASASGLDPSKSELIVHGELDISGKPGQPPVVFCSDAPEAQPGDWGGITLAMSGESRIAIEVAKAAFRSRPREFKNVVVKDAVCGINSVENRKIELKDVVFGNNRVGLAAKSQYDMKGCRFLGNSEAGLMLSEGARGGIKSSYFAGNQAGMYLSGLAAAECKDDTFVNNGTAVVCAGQSAPVFRNAHISHSRDCGVKILDAAQPVFGDDDAGGYNIFVDNKQYHMHNSGTNDIYAMNNYWGTMCPDTVAVKIWDGYDDPSCGIVNYLPLWSGYPVKQDTMQNLTINKALLPVAFELKQNHPNPIKLNTSIAYALPRASLVKLRVYNIAGQLVSILYEGNQDAGYYSMAWDGKDNAGCKAVPGIYFYRLSAGDYQATRKMVLIK
jgi:parallel beta-helix repeat protein